ncbi:MAG: hypothetical protein GX755_09810 [Syntrophomonadaceae bacterium]|nr:hypothetical protein [Syntrophomonadaceae bacterium]
MCNLNTGEGSSVIQEIVKKIAKRRSESLRQAREQKLDCVERAYFMAEANAYNVVLDIIANEFGDEAVWRYTAETRD